MGRMDPREMRSCHRSKEAKPTQSPHLKQGHQYRWKLVELLDCYLQQRPCNLGEVNLAEWQAPLADLKVEPQPALWTLRAQPGSKGSQFEVPRPRQGSAPEKAIVQAEGPLEPEKPEEENLAEVACWKRRCNLPLHLPPDGVQSHLPWDTYWREVMGHPLKISGLPSPQQPP